MNTGKFKDWFLYKQVIKSIIPILLDAGGI